MVQLAEISWTEAKKIFKEYDVALIPVGSTEQHGPHNPLGTDHLLAEAVAKHVGDKTGVPVTPIIPVGISEHHRHFNGSLWTPPNVFRDYMLAIAQSVITYGTTKIVFVNGHGGNTSALLEVCEKLRRKFNVFGCIIHSYPSGIGGGGHAGAGETSQNLFFHPHLVKMEEATATEQNTMLGSFEMKGINRIGPAMFPWDTIDLTDTGLLGAAGTKVDATKASIEMGKQLMEPHLEELVQFIEQMKKTDVSTLLTKPLRK